MAKTSAGKGQRPAKKDRNRKPGTTRDLRRTKILIVRVAERATRGRAAEARAAAEPDVPEARIDRTGGTVSVEIAFGHAQHGKYTIQLFDASGTNELSRETG